MEKKGKRIIVTFTNTATKSKGLRSQTSSTTFAASPPSFNLIPAASASYTKESQSNITGEERKRKLNEIAKDNNSAESGKSGDSQPSMSNGKISAEADPAPGKPHQSDSSTNSGKRKKITRKVREDDVTSNHPEV